MTTWYHGTSSNSGMTTGEWIDPSRGSFEPGVWATSSLKVARQWAQAASALGGEPEVYEIEIIGEVAEVEIDETDAPDADAVVCRIGEGGAPTIFIRASLTGLIGQQIT